MIITPRGLYTQPHTSFAGSVMVFAPAAFSILNAQYFVPASFHFSRFKGYCGGSVNSEEANCHCLILQWASTSVVDWQAPLPTEVSMSWSVDWISFSLIWRKVFAGEIKLRIFEISWMMWVGQEGHQRCPYEKRGKRKLTYIKERLHTDLGSRQWDADVTNRGRLTATRSWKREGISSPTDPL